MREIPNHISTLNNSNSNNKVENPFLKIRLETLAALEESIDRQFRMINIGFYTENYDVSTFKTFCSERKSLSGNKFHEIRNNRLAISVTGLQSLAE